MMATGNWDIDGSEADAGAMPFLRRICGAWKGGGAGVPSMLLMWWVMRPLEHVFPACAPLSGVPYSLPKCPKHFSHDPVSSLKVAGSVALGAGSLSLRGGRKWL